MALPSVEIVMCFLLAQKSYTTIRPEGILFKSYFGQECYLIKKCGNYPEKMANFESRVLQFQLKQNNLP
jgi:hypothetical protein